MFGGATLVVGSVIDVALYCWWVGLVVELSFVCRFGLGSGAVGMLFWT